METIVEPTAIRRGEMIQSSFLPSVVDDNLKNYLRMDGDEQDDNLLLMIEAANQLIDNAIGGTISYQWHADFPAGCGKYVLTQNNAIVVDGTWNYDGGFYFKTFEDTDEFTLDYTLDYETQKKSLELLQRSMVAEWWRRPELMGKMDTIPATFRAVLNKWK